MEWRRASCGEGWQRRPRRQPRLPARLPRSAGPAGAAAGGTGEGLTGGPNAGQPAKPAHAAAAVAAAGRPVPATGPRGRGGEPVRGPEGACAGGQRSARPLLHPGTPQGPPPASDPEARGGGAPRAAG